MLEQETMGELSQETFEKYMEEFTKMYGKANRVKRLKFSYWNPEVDKNFDIQLRITNKVPKIMIKRGVWENLKERKMYEYEYEIVPDHKNVMNSLNSLEVLPDVRKSPMVQQFENYLWEIPGFELKLARQFNNETSKYLYEVELLDQSYDLQKFVESAGLSDYIVAGDVEFWEKWNDDVNMSGKELTKAALRELVAEYL